MLQFNPSLKPKAPDFSGIAALLGQANVASQNVNAGVNSLVSTFDDYGKQRRSSAVTDLFGSGQLDGLSEQEQRALIAKTAGGSTTAQNQQLVKNLLGSTRATTEAEAKVKSDALAQQNLFEMLSRKQDFSSTEAEKKRKFSGGETEKERNLKIKLAGESNSLQELLAKMREQTTIRGQDISSATTRRGQNISSGDAAAGRQVQYAGQEVQKRGQDIQQQMSKDSIASKLLAAKYSKPKEDTMSKLGVAELTGKDGNAVDALTEEFNDYLNNVNDPWFNTELDKTSKSFVKESILKYIITPEGQRSYYAGGIESVYNKVKSDFLGKGYTLEDLPINLWNMFPGGESPFQQALVKQ